MESKKKKKRELERGVPPYALPLWVAASIVYKAPGTGSEVPNRLRPTLAQSVRFTTKQPLLVEDPESEYDSTTLDVTKHTMTYPLQLWAQCWTSLQSVQWTHSHSPQRFVAISFNSAIFFFSWTVQSRHPSWRHRIQPVCMTRPRLGLTGRLMIWKVPQITEGRIWCRVVSAEILRGTNIPGTRRRGNFTWRYRLILHWSRPIWGFFRFDFFFFSFFPMKGKVKKKRTLNLNYWRERRAKADLNQRLPVHLTGILLLGHTALTIRGNLLSLLRKSYFRTFSETSSAERDKLHNIF